MVACDATACWWNRGGFCSAKITVLHNGMCHRLVNRNGQPLPQEAWRNPWFSDDVEEENNSERIEENE